MQRRRLNIREGMRRVGLTLGVLGAIAAAVLGWSEFRTLLRRREDALLYQKTTGTPLMRKVTQAARQQSKDWFAQNAPQSARQTLSIGSEGIQNVEVDQTGAFVSVGLIDGTTLYPSTEPAVLDYAEALSFPLFGFVVPWGSVRLLAWIGTGFFITGENSHADPTGSADQTSSKEQGNA